ncbi:ATP-binding cassette domain-containing protein [Falsihalocynthiibacter sp. SS001]|uniref:ATP-binding cassette domain-containing protein n=1 Tax=Falsihalocynthiibacter sp. SS001 TaxID=3349698 RepID=UPI0036D2F857
MTQAPLIEVKDVTKRYGNLEALRGVDFHIDRNEVVGLLGDNGAGKSTLVKLLSGINPPTSGEVFANGVKASLNSRQDAESIGIETIYQDMAVVGEMEIWRNMFLGRELRGKFGFLKENEMKKITLDELSSGVDISGIDSADQMVGSLSGGQRQAVAIARAVHFRKSVLLLDEPTSALSVRETNKLLDYIDGLRDKGTSAAFVTHNIYHAYSICDRFVVMSHGRKVHDIRKEDTSVEGLTQMVINS